MKTEAKKTLQISVGQDYSAYGILNVKIPAEEVLTEERIAEIVEEAISTGGYEDGFFDLDLEVDYSTGQALRVIDALIVGDASTKFDGFCLDENYCDLGYACSDFIKGRNEGFGSLLQAAVKTKHLPSIEMETIVGEIDIDGFLYKADFEVRKGATLMEKDHAFMCALAQNASISYESANDVTED